MTRSWSILSFLLTSRTLSNWAFGRFLAFWHLWLSMSQSHSCSRQCLLHAIQLAAVGNWDHRQHMDSRRESKRSCIQYRSRVKGCRSRRRKGIRSIDIAEWRLETSISAMCVLHLQALTSWMYGLLFVYCSISLAIFAFALQSLFSHGPARKHLWHRKQTWSTAMLAAELIAARISLSMSACSRLTKMEHSNLRLCCHSICISESHLSCLAARQVVSSKSIRRTSHQDTESTSKCRCMRYLGQDAFGQLSLMGFWRI